MGEAEGEASTTRPLIPNPAITVALSTDRMWPTQMTKLCELNFRWDSVIHSQHAMAQFFSNIASGHFEPPT